MLSPETADAVAGLGYIGLPLAVEFGKKHPTSKENCPGIRNSKFARLLWELQDYVCVVLEHVPIVDTVGVQSEFGIVFTPWGALPQADTLITAVSHKQYWGMLLNDLQPKLLTAGISVDISSACPSQAMTEVGLRFSRM
jgi:UDP-N-acetyl-D-galactosamine dehydrogenase